MSPAVVKADDAEHAALAAACGLIACADGWVTVHEREALMARLRATAAGQRFDLGRVVDAFDSLIRRFEIDPDAAEGDARRRLRRVRGGDGLSIVEAASAVAGSDGGLDGAERETLLEICDLLGVDGQSMGLIEPHQRAMRPDAP